MWGEIAVLAQFACLLVVAVIWVRMAVAHHRVGMRLFALPVAQLPATSRRQLLRAIRRGEDIPAEHRDAALGWARHEVMRRGVCWSNLVMVGFLTCALRAAAGHSDWRSVAAFWSAIAAMPLLVWGGGYLWRDQLAAARLLRGTSRPA